MSIRLTILLGAGAVAVLTAAGCGGEDDAGGDSGSVEVTTSSLSKAQYVKRANEACGDARSDLLARTAEWSKENGSPDAARRQYGDMFAAVFVPMMKEEIAEVRSLGAPAKEEKEIEAMLTAKRKAIEEFEAEDVESAEEAERIFADSSRLLYGYGLSVCSFGAPSERAG